MRRSGRRRRRRRRGLRAHVDVDSCGLLEALKADRTALFREVVVAAICRTVAASAEAYAPRLFVVFKADALRDTLRERAVQRGKHRGVRRNAREPPEQALWLDEWQQKEEEFLCEPRDVP